jgi:hypothetical protein
MTKKEMCVALAKDAIKHVKTEKFTVAKGAYCVPEYEEDGVVYYNRHIPTGLQLDEILVKPTATCRICALGGLLAMYALRKDDTTIDQSCDRSEIVKRLGKYFATHELDVIETTFEGPKFVRGGPCGIEGCETCIGVELQPFIGGDFTQPELKACKKFHEKYAEDEKRFIAIMRNIVRNEGTFKLPGLKK